MIQSLFTFLFKYELLVFQQGDFVLGATRSMWLVAALAGLAGLYALWTYQRLVALRGRDRAVLLGVRLALFLVLLFALLRPMLLLKVAVPQQNFVGILLDDSRSMQMADHDGKPRSDFVTSQLGRPDAPLLTALGKRFQLRVFRFSSTAERLQSTGDLKFEGTGTRLGEALDRARQELSGLPVAGLVLVSDGSDNADKTIDESIAGLKAQAMPVFAVGVGRDRLTRDVQVTRVETPRRALKGASLVLDVVVTQIGYAGAKVPLFVEDEGRIVSSQDIVLPGDGEVADGEGAAQDDRRRRAHSQIPHSGADGRGSRAEQPARRADRQSSTAAKRSCTSKASRGPSRSSSARRRPTTTTCRSCCCSARPRPR